MSVESVAILVLAYWKRRRMWVRAVFVVRAVVVVGVVVVSKKY